MNPASWGWDWLQHLQLDRLNICLLWSALVEEILATHLEVFWEELSTLQGYKATIHMESSAHPKLCKAQAVPYARGAKVGQELDQLVADGILGPV